MIDEYAYAVGRARALEARIRNVDAMHPAQLLKEYEIEEKNIDASLEKLLGRDFSEFAEWAPDAVRPFILLEDMISVKALARRLRGEKIGFSRLASLHLTGEREQAERELVARGYGDLAGRAGGLLKLNYRQFDLEIEKYFTSKIRSPLFSEFLSTRAKLVGEGKPQREIEENLLRLVHGLTLTKNMDEASDGEAKRQR
ncbi:MAG: hypothetical protein NT157_04700 [Candidatus Micrarchaeota archaeon]|nr:hypothetical protein [Candidatus Micrarchaeota archaeon]